MWPRVFIVVILSILNIIAVLLLISFSTSPLLKIVIYVKCDASKLLGTHLTFR